MTKTNCRLYVVGTAAVLGAGGWYALDAYRQRLPIVRSEPVEGLAVAATELLRDGSGWQDSGEGALAGLFLYHPRAELFVYPDGSLTDGRHAGVRLYPSPAARRLVRDEYRVRRQFVEDGARQTKDWNLRRAADRVGKVLDGDKATPPTGERSR